MDESPFPYQGPLQPEEVEGRDELLADLTERATRHTVTALVGPRRYGKTSVLRRLSADLTEVTTVWVDLYGIASASDLAVALDRALDIPGTPLHSIAQDVATTLQLSLGVVKATLARPARSRPDPEVVFTNLLEVLVKAAVTSPTLLVLDEFSSIAAVPSGAAKIRTALQHHYRDISIVFAGSAPSVMRQLFTDRAEPFYGQADIVDIEPLTAGAVHQIVTDGFIRTDRRPGITAPLVIELTEGHPQRTMQVTDAVWRHTPVGSIATESIWSAALGEVRRQNADSLSRIYDAHSNSSRKVLRIVAHDESIFGTAGSVMALNKNAATEARTALLADGQLRKDTAGKIQVTDPLLADWIRTTLPLP